MDKTTELWEFIKNRVKELQESELKYHILTEYIKNEAKDIYFDRDKILKMIDILDQKPAEEKEEKEQNENE